MSNDDLGVNFRIQPPKFVDNRMEFTTGIKMAKDFNEHCIKLIVKSAKEQGITDLTLLNEKAIVTALKKQIPRPPIFYDSKFRQRGLKYGEHTTIENAYNCPYCNLTVWETDKNEHCHHCGQALDWSNIK